MAEQSAQQVAKRTSWRTLPLGPMVPFHYQATFSQEEYVLIRRGLIPEVMEDKWFVFWEDDSLFLHRSWTGHCLYRVNFHPSADRFQVTEAAVSADLELYRRGPDEYEAALLDFLIRGLLLRQSVEFPLPPGLPVSGAGLYQHHIAGTAFRMRTQGGTQAAWLARFKRLFRR